MGEMAYKFFKDNLRDNRSEYPGTEFKFPILYGLTGKHSASNEMIEAALKRIKEEKGGHFLDALWLAEQVESGCYSDHEEYFISDDRFRSSCVGLNAGSNAWALLLGGDSRLTELAGLLSEKKFKIYSAGKSSKVLKDLEHISYGDRETGVVYFGQLMARYALIYARSEAGSSHAISHEIEENAPGVMFVTGILDEQEKLMVQSMLSLGVPLVILGGDQELVGMVYETKSIPEMVETAWGLRNVRARLVEKAIPDVPLEVGPVFSREKISEPALEVKGSEKSFIAVTPNPSVSEDELVIKGNKETPTDISVHVELGNPVVDNIVTVGVESTLIKVVKYIHGVQLILVGGSVESLKVSKEALDKGFQYIHLLKVIQVELRNKYPEIGPMRIKLILDHDEVSSRSPAIKAFQSERKQVIDNASDETVDAFYGCMRCASFSLSHACTISPDRPPQCGGSPWYIMKADALLAPNDVYNKNSEIPKGELFDSAKGEYSGVNSYVRDRTEGRVDKVFMHSVFDHPHTACSCFQNIVFYIPEVDGIGLMDRKYDGEAPGGWTWQRLGNNVAGYQNTEGFGTFGTLYLKSEKFFQADGGYARAVWMTSSLKSIAGDAIPEERKGKIATEKDATSLKELKEFLGSS